MRNLKKALERERSYLVELRRDFHRHPELGLCEFRTAKRIEGEIGAFQNFPPAGGRDRRSWHFAWRRRRPGVRHPHGLGPARRNHRIITSELKGRK